MPSPHFEEATMRTGKMRDGYVERFWSKVQRNEPNGCWEWLGGRRDHKKNKPYGVVLWNGKSERSHRVAYTLYYGAIPHGMSIDHTCHNTMCVNPKHLRVCTHSQNMRNAGVPRTNKSGYKGVFRTASGNYSVSIATDNGRIWLGTFSTAEEAHCVYCVAAAKYHGVFANTGAHDV